MSLYIDVKYLNLLSSRLPLYKQKTELKKFNIKFPKTYYAISKKEITLTNLSNADDTKILRNCLKNYESKYNFNCENAGTVFRFLTAFFAIQNGKRLLNGSLRMQNRPIGHLVDALIDLGAIINFKGRHGFYQFENGVNIVSAGMRDPDSDDLETKM